MNAVRTLEAALRDGACGFGCANTFGDMHVDLSKYQSVVIWCEQFSVLFAAATLS